MIGRRLLILSFLLSLSAAEAAQNFSEAACTGNLLNSRKDSLIVMAPKGHIDSKKHILAMIERESREKGFQVFLGRQFLRDNWAQNRYGLYRFVQIVPLANDQMQAYVYEGRITSFVWQGRTAKIVLKSSSERVILRIADLDHFYFM